MSNQHSNIPVNHSSGLSQSSNRKPVEDSVLHAIANVVGERGCITDEAQIAPHCVSWRDNWRGRVSMVVQPANTEEVAQVMRICFETNTPVVPQGGNTGLTGASQPHDDYSEVILSTSRMNSVRNIDLDNDTVTLEAGCILEHIQKLAADNDRFFPLSLAAEGSCQIGGNLATNAGGTQVLRYGNARNLVLGLEVVLADGRIWNGLRGLRKDNTGYDLKQLFMGSEGTLGIITAAVLRLWPSLSDRQTAFVALPSVDAAVTLLNLAKRTAGDNVTAFELIHNDVMRLAIDHVPDLRDPFGDIYPWYVLMDVSGQGQPGGLRSSVESLLAQALEDELIIDAVLAESQDQSHRLWALREALPEAQNKTGVGIKHDISVPISSIATFVRLANERIESHFPGARPLVFGHVGDGNLHYNVAQPLGASGDSFQACQSDVNRVVHGLANELHGSISAEHGLGRLRMLEAEHYKSNVELDLMRAVKKALDPTDILNPGKVVRG